MQLHAHTARRACISTAPTHKRPAGEYDSSVGMGQGSKAMTTTLSTSDALATLDLPETPDVTESPREGSSTLARTENP